MKAFPDFEQIDCAVSTHNPQLTYRKPPLYPAELRGHSQFTTVPRRFGQDHTSRSAAGPASSSLRKRLKASLSRDLTVPSGRPVLPAIWPCDNPS